MISTVRQRLRTAVRMEKEIPPKERFFVRRAHLGRRRICCGLSQCVERYQGKPEMLVMSHECVLA